MPRVPSNALQFKRLLLRWFRAAGRDLPWRRTRDPYRIVVSEFMLQQTQVPRVAEFYPRFLARFPTIESLARARPAQVREAWEGLGYYARARNLHALSRAVVNDGGRIPHDPDRLTKLPGVGPYTAGAIASFAYEKRVPAVDTNVARVLGRAFRTTRRPRDFQSLAHRLLPTRRATAWEFNQALMDLGATICTARKPNCPACPVRSACNTGRRSTKSPRK